MLANAQCMKVLKTCLRDGISIYCFFSARVNLRLRLATTVTWQLLWHVLYKHLPFAQVYSLAPSAQACKELMGNDA